MVIKPPEVSEHDAVTAGCPHTIPPLAEGSRGQKERVEPATLVRGALKDGDEELGACSRAHASEKSPSILTVE